MLAQKQILAKKSLLNLMCLRNSPFPDIINLPAVLLRFRMSRFSAFKPPTFQF